MSYCKDCSRRKTSEWRRKNRTRWNSYVREHRQRPDIKARRDAKRRADEETKRLAGVRQKERRDPELRRLWRRQYEASEKVKAYRKAYKARLNRISRTRELNKRPEIKAKRAARIRDKRKIDPKFALDGRMYCSVRQSLRRGKEGVSWKAMVPYSLEELKVHIESKFLPGMNWLNMSEWHIDHVIPAAAFEFSSFHDDGFKKCWALSNLQPLWWSDNLAKGNKMPDGSRAYQKKRPVNQ